MQGKTETMHLKWLEHLERREKGGAAKSRWILVTWWHRTQRKRWRAGVEETTKTYQAFRS